MTKEIKKLTVTREDYYTDGKITTTISPIDFETLESKGTPITGRMLDQTDGRNAIKINEIIDSLTDEVFPVVDDYENTVVAVAKNKADQAIVDARQDADFRTKVTELEAHIAANAASITEGRRVRFFSTNVLANLETDFNTFLNDQITEEIFEGELARITYVNTDAQDPNVAFNNLAEDYTVVLNSQGQFVWNKNTKNVENKRAIIRLEQEIRDANAELREDFIDKSNEISAQLSLKADNTRVTGLETKFDGLTGGLRTDVTTLQNKIATAETDIDNLEANLASRLTNAQINTALALKQNANITLNGNATTVEAAIDGIENRVTNNENEIGDIKQDVQGLKLTDALYNTRITNLQTEVLANAQDIAQNHYRKEQIDSKNSLQDSKINSNTAAIRALDTAGTGRVSLIETRLAAAESAISGGAADSQILESVLSWDDTKPGWAAVTLNKTGQTWTATAPQAYPSYDMTLGKTVNVRFLVTGGTPSITWEATARVRIGHSNYVIMLTPFDAASNNDIEALGCKVAGGGVTTVYSNQATTQITSIQLISTEQNKATLATGIATKQEIATLTNNKQNKTITMTGASTPTLVEDELRGIRDDFDALQLPDLTPYATNTSVDAKIAAIPAPEVTQAELDAALALKANQATTYTKTETDAKIAEVVAAIPDVDLSAYSTTTQMNTAISTAVATETTNRNTALNSKADVGLGNVQGATLKSAGLAAGLADATTVSQNTAAIGQANTAIQTESQRATNAETALGTRIDEKLDINQGVANANKILGIGVDGLVVPQIAPTTTYTQIDQTTFAFNDSHIGKKVKIWRGTIICNTGEIQKGEEGTYYVNVVASNVGAWTTSDIYNLRWITNKTDKTKLDLFRVSTSGNTITLDYANITKFEIEN